MSAANVHNIQVLTDMKVALARFKSDAEASLLAARQEIQRAQEWLAERERHWQREVQRCEQIAQQAQAALARCQASGAYDREGRYYPPNCNTQEREVAHAQQQLRQTRAELETAQQATRTVQQQAAEFQREAQRLTNALNNDVAKATALLERKIAILQGYVGDSAPSFTYDSLDTRSHAQYKRELDTIIVNERYQNLKEPLLLKPLLAHEQVHAQYKSDAPYDEASLQKYTDEEMQAYQAQREAWLEIKTEFFERYPTATSRESLEIGNELLEEYRGLELMDENEWQAFRERKMDEFRKRMG